MTANRRSGKDMVQALIDKSEQSVQKPPFALGCWSPICKFGVP